MHSSLTRSTCSLLLILATTFGLADDVSAKSHVHLLRPREVRTLSRQQKADYYRNLQKILVTLESRQRLRFGRLKKTAAHLLWNFAFAQKEEGGACLMGGYFSRYANVNGKMECAKPEASQIWESDAGDFECGTTPSGEKKAYCNSAFFLFGNDSQERMCEPATNLISNCAKKFEERYLGPSAKDRLVADTAKLMEKMGPEEIDDYHRDLETYLDDMIAAEDDAETARVLKKQIGVLNGFKAVAQKSAPPLAAPGTEPAPKPMPEKAAVAPGEKSKLLGEELSCIRNGLVNAGFHPSEKYLALLGSGIQAYRGPFKTNDPESLKQYRGAVISMVQAYGVCRESVYPSPDDPREVSKIRNLLTANGGQVTSTGMDYVGSAIGADTKTRTEALFDLFGIRGSTSALFDFKSADEIERGFRNLFPDANTWQNKNLVDRQRTFTQWAGYGDRFNKTPFEKCRADAVEESKSEGNAFNVEALNRDRRRAAVKEAPTNDAGIQKLYRASEANSKVCAAMASACGMDADPVCEARNLVRPPAGQGAGAVR